MQTSNILHRSVNDYGETIVVRVVDGVKTLVDPCDQTTAVVVPTGRRARLIRFIFSGHGVPCGRDTLTAVFQSDLGIGFASVGYPNFSVLLRDLPEGQVVDVLPAADAAAAYAVLPRPMPVLYGAVAVQPVYAAVAA